MGASRWLRWILLGVVLAGAAGAVQYFTRAAPVPAADAPRILSTYRSLEGANKLQRLFRHAGVDFGAAAGTPVIAAAEGRVVQLIDYGPGCGLGVILEHPEFKRYTAYCHLQDGAGADGRGGAAGAHHRARRHQRQCRRRAPPPLRAVHAARAAPTPTAISGARRIR